MKKLRKIRMLFLATFFAVFVLGATFAVAQEEPPVDQGGGSRIMNRLNNVASQGGFVTDGTMSVATIVGLIINAFVSILGIIFVILIVSAGYNWMTSAGNDEKVKKATDTIKSSIIGLIVTLSSWAIWNFIFQRLIVGSN